MSITLSEPQGKVFQDKTRFRVLSAGRRFGKSFLSGTELLNAAIGHDKITGEPLKKQTVIYLAPTFQMCKGIMWTWLMEFAPKQKIVKKNQSDMYIEFKNGSTIQLRSADNYDSVRGLSLSFVVLDEVADIKEEAWNLVLRPALSDQRGGALFIGTPKGTNHFYEWYLRGKDKNLKTWSTHSYSTLEGGQVHPEEIEEARSDLSPVDFRQEYEASFESLSNRVCPEFDSDNMGTFKDRGDVVWVGLDFNVRKMTAVCANDLKWGIEVFDTISLASTNTHKMAKAIKRRFPGRQINICPDPAGKARSTKAESGETDHSILRDAGFNVLLPKGQLKIMDRVKSVNALVKNANGDRSLLVDYSCGDLERAMLLHQYDERTGLPDKNTKGNLDDIMDGLGYLVWITHPIKNHTKFERW